MIKPPVAWEKPGSSANGLPHVEDRLRVSTTYLGPHSQLASVKGEKV